MSPRRHARWFGMVAALMLATAGCSTGAASGQPSASTGASSQASTAAGGPIIVGMSAPMTGATANLGQNAQKAVQMGIDAINAQGGINGRQLQLVVEDNAGVPAQGVSASRKLIDVDHAVVVLGQLNSSVTLAAMPVFKEKQIPSITYVSTNATIYDQMGAGGNPWVFRINADDSMMADAFTSYLVDSAKSFEIVAQGDDYGRGAAAQYSCRLQKAGVKVFSTDTYDIGTGDFRPILNKIKSNNPAALLTVMLANDGAVFMHQYAELGLTQPIYSRGALVSQEFLNKISDNPSLGNGIVEASVWNFKQDLDLVNQFKAKYNETLLVHGAMAYYAFEAFAHAAMDANGDTSPQALQSALQNLSYDQTGLGHISFDDHDQAYPNMSLATITNGQVDLLKTIQTHKPQGCSS